MKKYIILIPVYNDWESVFILLDNIDEQIQDWDAEVSISIVNDASTEKNFGLIKQVNKLLLAKNSGADIL